MTKALRNRYTRRRLGGAVALATLAVVVLDAAAPAQQAPAAPSAAPAGPRVVASGVSVGGLDVSGLTAAEARQALRAQARRPLAVTFGGETRRFTPATLGASFDVDAGVRAALAAVPGTALSLDAAVDPLRLREWARELARDVNARPKSSRIVLRGKRPVATKSRPGLKVDRAALVQRAAAELRGGGRGPVQLPATILQPRVKRSQVGPAVVILRASNRLIYYRGSAPRGMRVQRRFRVATGAAAFPTPLGSFTLVDKQRNPWWYPPPSPWAEGAKPVPPGPGNPLGTRWMGLSEPLIGIHGTPDAASIGYSASHGCIRMLVPEAEWLFERIPEGTPVFILDA